jgi:hypothetical protein
LGFPTDVCFTRIRRPQLGSRTTQQKQLVADALEAAGYIVVVGDVVSDRVRGWGYIVKK